MIIEVYIPPMSGGFSVVPVEGSNKQIYDADLQEHVPDFRLTPASFKIEGWKIEGTTGSEVTTFVDLTIHEFKDNEWKEITSTSGITIDYTSGLITISLNNDPGTTREFRADFKVSNPYRPGMPLVESQPFNVTCVIEASSGFRLVPGYPQGRGAHVIKRLPTYGLSCPLFKGNEEWIQAFYRWYRVIDNVKTEITGDTAGGITGYDSSEMRVPFGELNERGNTYECVADPVTDLVGVNLISKAMISDDWNAIAAGISTPGEDADGKYFKISESLVYEAFGHGTKDVFENKIKYKTNQRYYLSGLFKRLSAADSHSGFRFRIYYTDDSYGEVGVYANDVTKTYREIITPIGKTIKRIGCIYGSNVGSLIYDIQLVEYFGENLVQGGSKQRLVNSSFIHKFASSPSKNYSVRFDKSETIEATGVTSRSFQIYDRTAGARVSNIANVNDGEVGVITVNDGIDPSHEFGFVAYAKQGIAAGSAKFYNLMLVDGVYTEATMPEYTPASGEFIPAIPDGALKPALSSNALREMMVLNKVYPAQVNKRDVLVDKSNNLNGGNAFVASCKLDTASGTIEKPELSYSCLWKSRDNGIWSDFGKGFTIAGAFDKKLEIASSYEKGLDNAKWAANFNGIDQILYNNNPSGIAPWGGTSNRTHIVEFIVNAYNSLQIPCCMILNNFGFVPAITSTGFLVMYVKDKSVVSTPYSAPSFKVEPGKVYRLEVFITINGEFTIKVNGKLVGTTFENAGTWKNWISMGRGPGGNYFNGKVLKYIVHNDDNSMYAEWDFQPTGGDRANMLKRKKADGSVETANKSDLTPGNVPDIDMVDPENGFFVTI